MKKSTKMLLIGGYVIVAGVILSATGYTPTEILGNMICGIGLMVLIDAIHRLIDENDSPK